MKTILFSFSLFCLVSFASAQSAPRFQKHEIANTGSFVYMPAAEVEFEESMSQDSSILYTASVTHEEQEFALIYVQLKDKVSSDENEALLIGYLDFLKGELGITGAAGYGKGHSLEDYPNAKGVIDYWQDADNSRYYVKGWITESTIVVFFVIRPDDDFNYTVNQMYTEGIRFAEE